MTSTYIIIPAYNAQDTVGRVVRGLREKGYLNVVVVDDGSSDETARKAADSGAMVLVHILNRGQGAALRTGTQFALENGADIIVHFDADGQHRVADLPAMLAPIQSGECEITIGSRFLRKNISMPLHRRIVLKTGILVQWILYGIKLSDAHNGLRAMTAVAASKIQYGADRMEHASEIVEEVKRKQLRYREIPVTIIYTRRTLTKGQSSWNSLRIGVKILLRKLL